MVHFWCAGCMSLGVYQVVVLLVQNSRSYSRQSLQQCLAVGLLVECLPITIVELVHAALQHSLLPAALAVSIHKEGPLACPCKGISNCSGGCCLAHPGLLLHEADDLELMVEVGGVVHIPVMFCTSGLGVQDADIVALCALSCTGGGL